MIRYILTIPLEMKMQETVVRIHPEPWLFLVFPIIDAEAKVLRFYQASIVERLVIQRPNFHRYIISFSDRNLQLHQFLFAHSCSVDHGVDQTLERPKIYWQG